MSHAVSEFVPARLDGSSWPAVEPLLRALMARPVGSVADLERWLLDRSELEAACAEAESDLYITMTCFTEDKAAQEAYARYVEEVQPRIKPLAFELDKKQVELFRELRPDPARYAVLDRDAAADVGVFRQENVPIQTELEKLSTEFQKIAGAMTVNFQGREQTLPMMAKHQEATDRSVREAAWRGVAERRLKDVGAIDGIYDQMVALRDRMGKNAGFKDFVGYAFKSKHRFDYTPEHCFDFHRAVERVVVPMLRRLDERRKKSLRVDPLRPWDKAVDVKGRAPLRPFEGGRDLVAKTGSVVARLDPRLAEMLATLGDGSAARGPKDGACLDLDSRKGKAPGGYQAMRDRSRRPFIFMNAAGLQKDVETMVHEAGHAFHSLLCVDEPLVRYRSSPLEFAEVASMSMELLTMPYWGGPGGYYAKDEDADRARRRQLENSVVLLPWIATIDAFQHWVYTNPGHTREERTAQWLDLDRRFGAAVSWDGIEKAQETQWQRQGHLFGAPFYYIEYGIAQLGALQLWLISLEQGQKKAVENYVRALSLGGSRPLPELFAAAGLEFDFGPAIVERLVGRVEGELAKLPE